MATNPFGGGTQFRTEHTLTTPEFQQEAVRQVREFFGGRKPAPQAPALEIPQVSQATQGGLIEQPSPFQVKSPVAGDVSMFNPNPVTFKDQTPLGPLEMTLPSPAQQGMTPNVQLQEGMTVTPIGGQPQDVLPSSAPPTLTVPAPAPQGQQGLAAFGGRTLSEYLTDPTVKGAGLMTDPQGRMIDPNVDRSKFEELSAARSAAAGPNLTSIAGRPRPGVDVPSLAMQRERMAAGLDPVEGAPMGTGMSQQQQRDYLAAGRDPATGQPIATQDPLKQAQVDKTRAETASILSKIGETSKSLNLTPAQESRDKAAGQALAAWDDGGRATVEGNIASLGDVIQGLETGQIKTRGFIDALPFGADWARAIMNPEAQDAKDRVQGVIFQTLRETLGAQFTEREGQRLVEASYNAKLSPEQNAARLRDYTTNLQRAAQARETQLRYLNENGTLQGYQGPNPEEVMMEGYQGGAGGSPIKGDVDVATAADAILQGQ